MTSAAEKNSEPPGVMTAEGTVQLTRMLPGPIERVWACLTESELRGKWLATGAMELHSGGKVQLDFQHRNLSAEPTPERFKQYECGHQLTSSILECEAPHKLSFTWQGEPGGYSEVCFELAEKGDQVQLLLTHRKLGSRKGMISVSSGWHTHLGILLDYLEGKAPRGFWSTHAALETVYEAYFNEAAAGEPAGQ